MKRDIPRKTKGASSTHWVEVCSKSFQILSVPDALALTCLRESHLAGCHSRKRRSGSIISVVAGIAGWVLLQRHNETLVAQNAVLDLRNRSVPRGTEPNPVEPPLKVNRAAAHWNIFLPFGSDAALYDIRLLAGSGELLVSTKADAKLTDGIAVIRISVDLSSRSPGQYVLRLTRNGSQESSYLVELR